MTSSGRTLTTLLASDSPLPILTTILAMCLDHDIFLSKVTQSLYLFSVGSSCNLYLDPITIDYVLPTLGTSCCMLRILLQVLTPSVKCYLALHLDTAAYIVESSTYIAVWTFSKTSGRSFTKTGNNSSLKQLPCCTPRVGGLIFDKQPLKKLLAFNLSGSSPSTLRQLE